MSDPKTAFVTGASRGIGKAIALALAETGFDVAITARTVEPGERREHSPTVSRSDDTPLPGSLQETAEQLSRFGGKVVVVVADMTDENDRQRIVPIRADGVAVGVVARVEILVLVPNDRPGDPFLLAAVFLLLWISFRPFQSLADPPQVTEVGNIANQVGYSLLFLVLAAWCLAHQPSRLLLLVRPVLIVTLLWFALTAVTSWEPSLSARRLAFTLLAIAIAGMVMASAASRIPPFDPIR